VAEIVVYTITVATGIESSYGGRMRSGHALELGYLGIEVPEPDALTPFFGEVLGLVPGEPIGADGTLTWRNDGKAHRLIVRPGPAGDAVFLGFEAVGDDALDAVLDRLVAAGHAVEEGAADECAARRVRRLVRVVSPWGVPVEIVTGLADAATPFASPLVPGGFLTEDVGFGHAVFVTGDLDASHAFLVDGLGLAQSDWIETELAPGLELVVRFYHCNERHHTVALAAAPFEPPQKLHHLMLETNDRDDVGAAFDRVWATDLAIANGLGRHDNDGMFSFYVVSPAGFQVEVGHGARRITPTWDGDRRYTRISSWGHQPLPRRTP
jgi:2,3-dihydroxybiphenyl 1,2-dioxygenase